MLEENNAQVLTPAYRVIQSSNAEVTPIYEELTVKSNRNDEGPRCLPY